MAKVQKVTRDEIWEVLKQFCDASRAKHGDYAYAAGYLEATLVDLLDSYSTAATQAEFLARVREITAKNSC